MVSQIINIIWQKMLLVSSCFTEHIIILSRSVLLESNLKKKKQTNKTTDKNLTKLNHADKFYVICYCLNKFTFFHSSYWSAFPFSHSSIWKYSFFLMFGGRVLFLGWKSKPTALTIIGYKQSFVDFSLLQNFSLFLLQMTRQCCGTAGMATPGEQSELRIKQMPSNKTNCWLLQAFPRNKMRMLLPSERNHSTLLISHNIRMYWFTDGVHWTDCCQ